ncbi:hypothetical protein GGI24_001547 [Coemansia furcata]|nr:hypothetical protein GGI24_001547 [Coemansia furcata]
MRHQLGLWAVLPLVVWQVVRAQTFKCDDADGKGRGYTINDGAKRDCQEGTFCYQLGKGVYCGVGSSDSVLPDSNEAAAAKAEIAPNACAKEGTATCKLPDGNGAAYIRCVNGVSQDFTCGGGSVCYQDGEGILCGATSSARACTPGAFKCSADDGVSADFSRCIGGEQVALTCGDGLTCHQEGPFHVRCASEADSNARAVYPAYPITSAESVSSTCAANNTTAAPSSTKAYAAPPVTTPTVNPSTTSTTIYNTVSGTTTTTTTFTAKPSMYTVTKSDDRKANGPMLIRSNGVPSPRGKNMVEIDVSYNPAEVAQCQRYGVSNTAATGAFDQPEAFSREMANYPMSQGYGASSNSPYYASSSNSPYYASSSNSPYYASSSNSPFYAPYSTADLNLAHAYPSPNSYAAPPTYNTAYSAQPTYNTAYDNAHQPLALNTGYATVVPDNIQLPQLIYSLQNAMQLSNQPPAGAYPPGPPPPPPPPPGPVYITVVPPSVCPPVVCPTVECPTVECPTKPSCCKPATHTVFISIESHCEKPTPKPVCCPKEPECECSSEHEHKHKHKHKHKHEHKKEEEECPTTPPCTTTETCEPTSTKKHKHSHSHSHTHTHKHKSKKEDECEEDSDCDCDGDSKGKAGECELEDCDGGCVCFGRAVVSVSDCNGESVTTLGKKLFACMSNEESASADPESVDDELNAVIHNAATSSGSCESCESPEPTCSSSAATHTALESVETGCHCESGGECKCGDKCDCKKKNSHTVIVSVNSSCEKPTACAPTSAKNTHTVIESIECSCVKPSPQNTHTVIESIECSCIAPSAQNTHTIIESIECMCVKPSPVAPKHTHTVFESVECQLWLRFADLSASKQQLRSNKCAEHAHRV